MRRFPRVRLLLQQRSDASSRRGNKPQAQKVGLSYRLVVKTTALGIVARQQGCWDSRGIPSRPNLHIHAA
jgi:hypothetical protein